MIRVSRFAATALLLVSTATASSAIQQASPITVDAQRARRDLLAEEDTDGDRRITRDDGRRRTGSRGDARFEMVGLDGRTLVVESTYHLANLLQELTLAVDAGDTTWRVDLERVRENPVRRISRLVRTLYWDNLTRRIDAQHLDIVLPDDKMPDQKTRYLYVPDDDDRAYAYFSEAVRVGGVQGVRVERLPESVTPQFVQSLEGRHGLLTLALEPTEDGSLRGVPYVVPGGRFNEMYGWDSYFETLGLLVDDRVDLARAMVDNFVYQITHYGKILNANRTYYLTRSQPPFLTSMTLAVYERIRARPGAREWLARALRAAIREYESVWTAQPRLTACGLSRYFGSGAGPPPEVEPGHFDAIYAQYAGDMDVRRFEQLYVAGDIGPVPELDAFFVHDRAVRESGHDTTYRWHAQGDRCADFVTVDLNALLHKTEIDVARTIRDEFGNSLEVAPGQSHTSALWYERARRRRELMRRYLWDEQHGMFFDYDFVNQRRHAYFSATALYPLWAVHADDPTTRIVDRARARRLVDNALRKLEKPGGLAASASDFSEAHPQAPPRQWDYPYGWPPHQMLAWRALQNEGFDAHAIRLAYKWLYTIVRNAADYNGTVPEKFDVVRRSHRVFAEYGNVGTTFAYITREGFGWMNASFQVGLQLLPEHAGAALEELQTPEDAFR